MILSFEIYGTAKTYPYPIIIDGLVVHKYKWSKYKVRPYLLRPTVNILFHV